MKGEDPVRSRLYYAKSFIYPLAAAPFVFLFGTNGFLVFHALLLALDLFVAYTFLAGRGSSRPAALAYATVFLAASVVPVYYVWLTPELFNFSLTLYALFLWSYKETCGRPAGRALACVPARQRIGLRGGGAGRHPDVLEADARAAHVSPGRAGARPAASGGAPR